jgi:hypothetical protein
MSLRKMFVGLCLLLSVLCMLSAVNIYAQAQNEDKKAEDESSDQATVTTTITTSTPAAVDIPATTGKVVTPNLPRVPGAQSEQRRAVGVQARSADPNIEAALRKAEEEMRKVETQLRELDKGGNQAALQKAREEMQKAMQKAKEEMQKAKAQLDKTAKEYRSIQVGPGGTLDAFSTGGGFGGFGGRSSGGYGISGGKIVMDNRTGQMIVKGPMEIITGPEANELREKEEKVVAAIEDVGNLYRSNKDKEERAKLKTKLAELVGQQFAIRQEYREMQVSRLEKELARVRESVKQRSENREQIIKRRMAQLLNEEDDLEF